METPTARVLEDGMFRFGVSQALPYRWFGAGLGFLPGLEVSGRVSELRGIPGGNFSSAKTRSVEIRYQIFPESKLFPALAIGANDPFGERVYPSEYIVLSRQLFPFDFTLGIGRERLRGPIHLPFQDEVGLFGGIEWEVNQWLHLMCEYNPIEYEKDKGPPGRVGASDWPVNLGLRGKIFPGVDLNISFQRGDALGVQLYFETLLGEPIRPHRADPPAQVPVDRRPLGERDIKNMVETIHEAIHRAGFADISVYTDGDTLTAEFDNNRYLSDRKAVGRVLRILLFHSPSDIKNLTAVVRRRNFPILRVSIKPEHLENYIFGKIPDHVFEKLVHIETTSAAEIQDNEKYTQSEERGGVNVVVGVKPELEIQVGDLSNYVQVRPGINPYAVSNVWKGAYALASYDIPFYSNIGTNTPSVNDAVRSDWADYYGDTPNLERLMLDQAFRFSERIFGRVGLGYLEKMYAGAGGEILTFLGDGNLGLGFGSDWVIKREPDEHFGLTDLDAYTLLANVYYHIPTLGLTGSANVGRFLYGDYGVLFHLSRELDTGVQLGFWLSYTDSDKFTSYNKGYHDSGFFMSLPMRMFVPYDSTKRFNYAFSQWTRDVAAVVDRWQDLYGMGADVMPSAFRSEIDEIKE